MPQYPSPSGRFPVLSAAEPINAEVFPGNSMVLRKPMDDLNSAWRKADAPEAPPTDAQDRVHIHAGGFEELEAPGLSGPVPKPKLKKWPQKEGKYGNQEEKTRREAGKESGSCHREAAVVQQIGISLRDASLSSDGMMEEDPYDGWKKVHLKEPPDRPDLQKMMTDFAEDLRCIRPGGNDSDLADAAAVHTEISWFGKTDGRMGE